MTLATANVSVPLTAAVSVDACAADSMASFGAFASVILGGAQQLHWDNMATCAPVGSAAFDRIASVNKIPMQWAGPLFARTPARSCVEHCPTWQHGSPAEGRTVFVVTDFWSTSSLELPALRGNNSQSVSPRNPGALGAADQIQSMGPEMIAVRLTAVTASTAAGRGQELVLVMSTQAGPALGASSRTVQLRMRVDTLTIKPYVADPFQGFKGSCGLVLAGATANLTLSGGMAQLIEYERRHTPQEGRKRRNPRPRVMDGTLWT